MAKRKSKYDKVAPKLIGQTCEDLRKEFPAKLISLFVKLHDSKYGEKEHKKYKKEAAEFLKGKAEDAIEQGKLIVRLAKATFDLVEEEKHEKEEKQKEIKIKKD